MKKLNAIIFLLIFNITFFSVLNSQLFPVAFDAAKMAAKKHQAKEYAKKEAETVESAIDDINVITRALSGIEDRGLLNSARSAIKIAKRNANEAVFNARLAAEYAKNEAKKSPENQNKEDALEAEKYAQIAESYLQEIKAPLAEEA